MSPDKSAPSGSPTRPRVSLPVLIGGLALAYSPSFLPPLAAAAGLDLSPLGPPAVLLWNWLAVAALLGYVFRVERLGFASLRLTKPSERDLEWAGYLAGAALLWHWAMTTLFPSATAPPDGGGGPALIALGPVMALLLVITVSLTEEILWRGYVVERLGAWIGPLAAAVIGLTVFAAGHLAFFGTGWLLTNLPGAALLYVLLLWRRNLWACILAHLITDLPIFVLALIG